MLQVEYAIGDKLKCGTTQDYWLLWEVQEINDHGIKVMLMDSCGSLYSIGSIENWTYPQLPFIKILEIQSVLKRPNSTPNVNKCHCVMRDLLMHGCKCGGV